MPIVSASVPASLPPSGTAGGDLGGTYPNPTVDLNTSGGVINGSLQVLADASGDLQVQAGAANVLGASASGSFLAIGTGEQLTVASGLLKFEAANGDDLLLVHTPNNQVELSPQTGQVDAISGYLRLAANSAPADATLFNGSFALWLDTATPALKVKAKVSGSFVTATILLV